MVQSASPHRSVHALAGDERPSRVAGGSFAYGAPGPRVDLMRLFDAANRPASPSGGLAGEGSRSSRVPTVNLSDGTRISFTVAGAHLQAAED